MIVHDSTFIRVDFIKSKDLLLSKWKQAKFSAADFKQELILCRHFCDLYSVKRLIMDQEQFCYTIPFELFSWIENEFNLPVYKKGVQCLAFVLAYNSSAQLSIMNFFDKINSVFSPKYFPNQQQAITWITANAKEKLMIEPNRPPKSFKPTIDIRVNADKSKAIIQFEFPIDSLSHSLHGLKHHMNKMSFMREHWTRFLSLTKREEDVLKLLVKGLHNQEIADTYCISAKTVKTHRRNMIKKLDAKNLIDLYKYAESFDLV